jgi:hypothetical protein
VFILTFKAFVNRFFDQMTSQRAVVTSRPSKESALTEDARGPTIVREKWEYALDALVAKAGTSLVGFALQIGGCLSLLSSPLAIGETNNGGIFLHWYVAISRGEKGVNEMGSYQEKSAKQHK